MAAPERNERPPVPVVLASLEVDKSAKDLKKQLAKFGIDLDDVLRHIAHSGTIVDVSDGDDRVMIDVE